MNSEDVQPLSIGVPSLSVIHAGSRVLARELSVLTKRILYVKQPASYTMPKQLELWHMLLAAFLRLERARSPFAARSSAPPLPLTPNKRREHNNSGGK
jgi:hypothetical protein